MSYKYNTIHETKNEFLNVINEFSNAISLFKNEFLNVFVEIHFSISFLISIFANIQSLVFKRQMNMAVKITNKDVIQSYLMTVSKYDFSVYEKRILYRRVEAMQCELEGKKLHSGLRIEKNIYDDRVVMMPISSFLANDDDENYTRVKKALIALRNKTFEFDDGRTWKLIGIIEKPQFDYKRGWVRFEIQPEIYNAVLNFSKGFRKYELKTAMEFTSQYSMRFYELMSGQQTPLTYTIEDLKIMFGVQNKYKRSPDFIKWIVKPAKEELDAKSPYSFEYKILKDGRSFHALKLYPKYQPEHRDEELEKHELQKQVSLGWDLDRLIRNYLKQDLLFTDQEIRNNIDLFKAAQKELDIMLEFSILKGKSREKKNPKGYIINSLKGKLKDKK